MTNAPITRNLRATLELATVVSMAAVAVAVMLSQFVGLGETWIVIGTVVVASWIGWRQPAARLRPQLQPVRVRANRRQAA